MFHFSEVDKEYFNRSSYKANFFKNAIKTMYTLLIAIYCTWVKDWTQFCYDSVGNFQNQASGRCIYATIVFFFFLNIHI